jgi:hypothetical protein
MISKIKKTIICRDVKNFTIDKTQNLTYTPKKGDIAVFEILELGKHHTIQSETKRNMTIIEGDFIMAAFAERYATEQFEGYLPEVPTEILDILGAGGAIGVLKSKHDNFKHIPATKVKLIGYVVDDKGSIINTIHRESPAITFNGVVPNNAKVILSIGSSMDSGKTTTAAFLARGLKTTGKNVAFIKLTGTCYTKDMDLVYDCGADVTVDFTDAGFPSTYMCDKQDLLNLYQTLLHKLAPSNPDFIVMEIADGLLQRETEFLLRDEAFMNTIYNVIFSCGDSLAVFFGIEFLADIKIRPAALSGVFTMSPLLIKEVRDRTSIPVLTIDELMTGASVDYFIKAYAN